MKNLRVIILLLGCIISTSSAQNAPPTLHSILSPNIANGYLPDTLYHLNVNFNENSNKRSFRLKITNQANPGVIGVFSPVASNIDTLTENGMFFVVSDTGTAAGGNFTWLTPASANETISFELIAAAEDRPNSQPDIVYTCIYQVTSSSFGLTGNCSNSMQVGIIEQNIFTDNFNLYPNPAEQSCTISYTLSESESIRIDILDSGGKLIQHVFEGNEATGVCGHRVSTCDLTTGIYLARVLISDKPHYHKFSVH